MAAVSFNIDVPSASLLAGNVGFLTGFEHIESVTVGSGGASSVSFSSIPQYYRHLQIRALTKDGWSGGNWSWVSVQFNNDSSASYAMHTLYGTGAAAGSESLTTQNYGRSYTGNSVQFGAFVMDVLDYSNTVKNKTVRQLAGVDVNGGGLISLGSSLWMSTSSVNSVTFKAQGGSFNFSQFSTFSLYGIR